MLPYSCSNCLQDLILSSAACPVSQNFTTCCLMLQMGELFCRGSNGWVLHRLGSRAIILVLVLCENDNRTCLNIADQCIQWWSFMLFHLLTPHFSPSSHCQIIRCSDCQSVSFSQYIRFMCLISDFFRCSDFLRPSELLSSC